ncbi:MAG TPA: YchJ family metal-binding protein [Rhabdochlamydiaceae bacterium]|nr:YchJ family metal-binding protein [Rhabdochlamydiaceae bacterium]
MKSEYDQTMPCRCLSGKQYEMCCRPFHLGKEPNTALQLMRSRFAAYALNMPDYIIRTTRPGGPQFFHDTKEWIQKISDFSSRIEFKGLEILGFQESGFLAVVTFVAHLIQDKKDVSFTEKSYFEKVNGQWLYHSGQLSQGRAPNLI